MGSQKIQGELWGQRPTDWASIQEATGNTGYEHVLQFLNIKPDETLLDVGCGSGFFSDLAYKKGADVTGIDFSQKMIDTATANYDGVCTIPLLAIEYKFHVHNI